MSTKTATPAGKSAAARRKSIPWRDRMRRLVAFLLVGACAADNPSRTLAQVGGAMGQGAMAPAGGLVNGAIARFQDLDANGPGWFYYGLNAADRGLGYRGSYMTLGGFIPYAEDDLGGFWSADLRTHLSNYGGFFSNVGFVRKQFIGGAIGGIGVYWDYDGDQNQYSPTTITDSSGSYTFAGGQTYQQVGVSAEFLTDYGNIRSNGYIPVGTTATTMGPFVGNSLLCQYGINAALAGADLEVGAYIPGLSDWAGMVSVGGYAFGNARYDLANGQDVVPYFGGVFTRLDLTLIENWDFSLQANNDSFFDWTGFARLTYRMGGSRRRNVPDQMEQPMMRNEHIVRAHQAPEQAINPFTGTPWKVIHVDNAYNAGTTTSAGTVENPVTTLADAETQATDPYDIVFVHQGISSDQPYAGGFTFQADNQYLVGQGSSLMIPTVSCGLVPIWASGGSAGYPVISTVSGTAITLTNGGSANPTVDHFQIVGSQIGISDGNGMPDDRIATVNDVRIRGTGPGQTGVVIRDLAGGNGTFNFTRMDLQSLTADGFVVDGQSGGNPQVNISDSTIKNTSGVAVVVNDVVDQGRVRVDRTKIDGTTGAGIAVTGGNLILESSTLTRIGTAGVAITGAPIVSGSLAASGTSTVQVVNSLINATVGVQGSAPNTGDLLNLTINQNTLVSPLGGNGINLAVNDGRINANIVGNNIAARQTTALTTGTAGGPSAPALLASNIYLTTSNTATGLNNLTIKAASLDNLVALNRNATVTTAPPANPVNTGTTSPIVPPPPPPNYNPSVVVPLPPP
jgi:hypothetical protein